jgi:osmotically inducible lipoprotein OsmB
MIEIRKVPPARRLRKPAGTNPRRKERPVSAKRVGLWLSAASIGLAGCASTPTEQQIGIGAGALLGGGLGAVLFDSTLGTAAGAAAGALIGNEIGKKEAEKKK